MLVGVPSPASSKPEDREVLSWTVHLAREHPLRTAVSVAFVLSASAGAFFAVGPTAAVIVAGVVVASLSEFLFPVRYVVTDETASCRMLLNRTEIRWANVKRCYVDNLGVKLSPLDRVSRLEAFRGVYLRFAGNENEVIETVKSLRPSHV